MGKTDLLSQAKSLKTAGETIDMTKFEEVKRELRATPTLQTRYVDTVKKYNPDGCADALVDCARELTAIARRMPTHSASPPKSSPASRRLKRQGKR